MAKEKEETKKPEGERKEGGKKKKLHLHEIRSTQARDGSIVHSHSYKEHPDHPFTMPERGPMATSASPEEAGQHVAEQFAMNGQGGAPEQEATPEGGPPEAGQVGG